MQDIELGIFLLFPSIVGVILMILIFHLFFRARRLHASDPNSIEKPAVIGALFAAIAATFAVVIDLFGKLTWPLVVRASIDMSIYYNFLFVIEILFFISSIAAIFQFYRFTKNK